MRNSRPDAVIVGASAAGLLAAVRLSEMGTRVRILERTPTFPPVPRTLITTGRLRNVVGALADASIVNEINGFELFADGRVATIPLRDPDLIVERSTLMGDLAKRACSLGAEVAFGRRFVSACPSEEGFEVLVRRASSDGEEVVRTPTLIGADGAFSRVARGAGWPEQTTVPLVQAVVDLPAGFPSDTVRVWFRPGDTRYFFWLIPEGEGRGVIGLIGDARSEVRTALDRFLAEKSFEPQSYQAARIPLYVRWRSVHRRLEGGSVYLVGDAAGHVKPSTVGGLVTGFRGVDGVVESITRGRSRQLRSLRRELDRHSIVRRVLDRFGEPEYHKLLDLLKPSHHRLLASYSRDEAARLLWRLGVREPRFALFALSGLVGGRGQLSEDSRSRTAPDTSPTRTSQPIRK